MQEAVKRIQEKQEKRNEPILPADVTLCLAEFGPRHYPVILPKFAPVNIGDLVWFELNEPERSVVWHEPGKSVVRGKIVFVDGYCHVDGDLWTLAVAATKSTPIMAKKYAVVSDVDWE